MIDDLNSFIRKRVTVKSNDFISLIVREKHSKPYNKIGRHLLFASSSMTSSEAVLPIFPKMALMTTSVKNALIDPVTDRWPFNHKPHHF